MVMNIHDPVRKRASDVRDVIHGSLHSPLRKQAHMYFIYVFVPVDLNERELKEWEIFSNGDSLHCVLIVSDSGFEKLLSEDREKW